MNTSIDEDYQPTDEQYRAAAQDTVIMSDDLQIDEGAVVSVADDGAWVQCWVWVYDREIKETTP